MTNADKDSSILGVYSTDADGKMRLVHRYQGGDYGLEGIVEYFQLGSLESAEAKGHTAVVLPATEMKELKIMADAHSFDYEEGFIEMCLEMQRFVANLPGDSFRFTANF
ncbi:MAG: hypothetical protein ACE5KS_07680 [Woeseiaceae bacterium]